MKQLHDIQLSILQKLLFAPSLKYSELTPKNIENNQFQFHLDQLIKANFIEKKDNKYSLTIYGKEYANRIETNSTKVIKQAKIGVMNCCVRSFEGQRQHLIYTRLKHPFYGFQGFATGKVAYGETIYETSKRELKEETNLEGDPKLIGIYHIRVFSKANELLEDKFLYICRYEEPAGELIVNNEGLQEWVNEKDLKTYLKKPFDDVDNTIKLINNFKEIVYEEQIHITDEF